jgi:hypothetical protein
VRFAFPLADYDLARHYGIQPRIDAGALVASGGTWASTTA